MMINNCIIDPDKFLVEFHKPLNMTSTFSSISGRKHVLGIRAASFLEPRNRSKEDVLLCVLGGGGGTHPRTHTHWEWVGRWMGTGTGEKLNKVVENVKTNSPGNKTKQSKTKNQQMQEES